MEGRTGVSVRGRTPFTPRSQGRSTSRNP